MSSELAAIYQISHFCRSTYVTSCLWVIVMCMYVELATYVVTYVPAICDWICENPPLMHTMTRHSFHCQSMALSIS